MKKSAFVFSLFILAFFSGCRKPAHDIKMHGYFYDVNTGARLANGHFNFTIYYYSPASGSAITGEHFLGTTDATGYYEMIIQDAKRRRDKGKTYEGDFFMDQVGATSFTTSPDFSDRNDMNKDIGIEWQTSLGLIFHNMTPYDNNDVITDLQFEDPGNTAGSYLFNTTLTGQAVNDTIGVLSRTGRQILHSSVTKNNITTQRIDTIMVNPLARTYYHLDY